MSVAVNHGSVGEFISAVGVLVPSSGENGFFHVRANTSGPKRVKK